MPGAAFVAACLQDETLAEAYRRAHEAYLAVRAEIGEQVGRMNHLITDILDYARAWTVTSRTIEVEALAALMTNLGGHDLEALLEAFHAAADDQHDARPVVGTVAAGGRNPPTAARRGHHRTARSRPVSRAHGRRRRGARR